MPVKGGDDFSSFFSAGISWGVFEQDREGAKLGLRSGSRRLSQVELPIVVASANVNGALPVAIDADHGLTGITFDAVDLTSGDVLRCERK